MGDDEKALAVLTEAVSHRPDAELAGRIHRQVGKIQARGLELEAAVQSFTLAGDEETAHMIQEIGAGFGEALEARRELVGKIAQLRAMELELESLNDAEGVTAMRQRTAAFEQELDALEDNLEQVRQALRDL
jgi:hypothetical protein